MKIEIVTGADNNPVAEYFSSSSAPETDAVTSRLFCNVSADFARKLKYERDEAIKKYDTLAVENMLEVNKICKQRDEAMDVLSNLSHYLSCGLGDENTTAKEYGAIIREGINALLDPIVEEKEKFRKMFDLQTKLVVDLELRLMK